MTPEQQLHDALVASGLVVARVFPLGGPAGVALPFATYQRISTDRNYHMTGPSNPVQCVLRVVLWDRPSAYTALLALAEAVRVALDAGLADCMVNDESDILPDAEAPPESQLAGRALDVTLRYNL